MDKSIKQLIENQNKMFFNPNFDYLGNRLQKITIELTEQMLTFFITQTIYSLISD